MRGPRIWLVAVALLAAACATGGGGSPEPADGLASAPQAAAAPATEPATATEAAPAAEPAPAARPAPPADSAPEPTTPDEESYNNRIKWKTASEVDNFGFDVYRGDSPDGPFERLNPEVIEGAGTSDEPNAYEYVDDTIDPRRTYYYYVESISMDGVRERFTPVGKASPKIADEDESPG